MQGEKQELRCPECGSEDEFKIASTVWVRVRGADALTVEDESDDREYGSEDSCRCEHCGHQARMGDFYKEDQWA